MLGTVAEAPDLAHVLYRVRWRRDDAPEFSGQVAIVSTRRQPDRTWRLLALDVHLLQPRGGSVSYIPEEYSDLYEDDMQAAHEEALARRKAREAG